MATRWEQITELFKQTAREVTTTPASWRAVSHLRLPQLPSALWTSSF